MTDGERSRPTAREYINAFEFIGALVLGVVGFSWPGGPNILMLLACLILFIVALFESVEVERHGQ